MTEANSIRTHEPFVRHACFTLWRLEAAATSGGKPLKVPMHHDGVTRHSTMNPAPPLTAGQALEWLTYLRTTGVAHDRPNEVGFYGMGFRPGGTGLACLDVDACIDSAGNWSAIALEMMGRFPGALIEVSVSGTGLHFWFTSDDAIGRMGKDRAKELELYGDGQFIATGTVISGSAVTNCTVAVRALIAERWDRPNVQSEWKSADWERKTEDERGRTLAHLRSALLAIKHLADDRGMWVKAGQALSSLGEIGYALWAEWSSTEKFPGGDDLGKWSTFTGDRTDYPAIFKLAEEHSDWVNPARRQEVELRTFGVDPLPAGASSERPAPAALDGLSFTDAAGGSIPASMARVFDALVQSAGSIRVRYDEFLDRIMIDDRAFTDSDYGHLRVAFERRGFKPVPAEVMKSCVQMVAHANRFDSASEWLGALVWDGVSRIESAMTTYYGCAPTPYVQSVGLYLFTALAGRCVQPGIKADMALILVGLQGAMKTSAVEALAPTPEAFGEIDMSKPDDALSRSVRGKLVVELAELKGLSGRDSESVKAWFSRRFEEWVPKYQEFSTRYGRRFVPIGTDNKGEFLDDETGARRFLPVTVTRADVEGLKRDRDQLWAEGLVRFRAEGIAWRAAEELAKAEHGKYEVVDELLVTVESWLNSPPIPLLGQPQSVTPRGNNPVRGVDVLSGALGMHLSQIKRSDEMRVAKIMRRLNYERKAMRLDGPPVKVWIKR